jgi:hypothetical protein
VSVSSQHIHLLAKIATGCSRAWIGLAKKHAWFIARDEGWQGKLWGEALPSHVGERTAALE